jgi:hypothetical protein
VTGWDIVVDTLGLAAGAATVAAQRMRTMIPLRAAAIALPSSLPIRGILTAFRQRLHLAGCPDSPRHL